MAKKAEKTDDQWKKTLTDKEYRILRKGGTEAAFTGELLSNKKEGMYVCAGCGTPLFASEAKFDSGSGWPSFTKPVSSNALEEKIDQAMFTKRTEVLCEACGGHLGHVFEDGPAPTGLRYCINSGALHFQEAEKGIEKKERAKK